METRENMMLTIVTINLNNRDGLRKTMGSVAKQRYSAMEYVVIDGGSEDGSLDVIKEYEGCIANFKWLSEKDNGVFAAMNKGARMAKGEYVLFLNSGDYFVDGNVVNRVFEKEHTASFLIGRCQITKKEEMVWTAVPIEHYTLNYLYHNSIAHQATFTRRNVLEKYGYYREDMKLAGDWEFALKALILNSETTELLPIDIASYNTEGMSSDVRNKGIIEQEKRIAYKELHLENIVCDYAQWDEQQRNEMIMRWGWSKMWLRKPIEFIWNLKCKKNRRK